MIGLNYRDFVELQNNRMVVQSIKKKNQWYQSIKHHMDIVINTFNSTDKKLNKFKGGFMCNVFRSLIFKKYANKKIKPYKSKT